MNTEIGEFIKKYRKSAGKTQVDLANDLVISANYVSLIENGKKNPGKVFIKNFSNKYKIPSILLNRSTMIPHGKSKAERAIEEKLLNIVNEIEGLVLIRLKNERATKDKN